jgi:DNA polymerase III alpha subunit
VTSPGTCAISVSSDFQQKPRAGAGQPAQVQPPSWEWTLIWWADAHSQCIRAHASLHNRGRAQPIREGLGEERLPSQGIVVVRQRPGTAKGFVFVTVEDETDFANAIVAPRCFEAYRNTIVAVNAILIEGVVQNQDGVISLKADHFEALEARLGGIDVSRNFH